MRLCVPLIAVALCVVARADSKTEDALRKQLAATEAARIIAVRDKAALAAALLRVTNSTQAATVGRASAADAASVNAADAQLTANQNAQDARKAADNARLAAALAKQQSDNLERASDRGTNTLWISQGFIFAAIIVKYAYDGWDKGRSHRWTTEEATALVAATKELPDMGKKVAELEKNTNSITAAIVKLTAEREHARGVSEEKARGVEQADAVRQAHVEEQASHAEISPAIDRQERDH